MREPIAIVTDSGCDLSDLYINECENLYILPLRLNYPEGSYRCGIDISTQEVLRRMERGEVPKTSLPNPGEVEEIFENIKEKGIKKALFVMISSGLSGTCNMVRLMCEQHRDDLDSVVYDSGILSMGLGYMVMNAAQLVEEGVPFDQMLARLTAMRKNVDGFFYLSTLTYLSAGGRIGTAAKYVGNLMGIKPIIGCNDEGKYYPRGIGIGAKRTMGIARDMALNFIGKRRAEMTVLYTGADADAQKYVGMIRGLCDTVTCEIRELSSTLAVHVGPGMLAVCTRRNPE